MSMVSQTYKFIYVSGGRSATRSINATLAKLPDNKRYEPAKLSKRSWKLYCSHMPAKYIKEAIPAEEWNNFFKFTFVRNTYSWVVSSFFFWVKIGMCKMPKNQIMTMDDFKFAVEWYRTPGGRRHDEGSDIRSQHSYICDLKGNILLDFVGRFENLQDDFNEVCKRIGVKPIQLCRQNTSAASQNHKHATGVHWTEHYKQNPEAKDYVYANWKRDIDAFDYKLEY
jgi:hypothetical protein